MNRLAIATLVCLFTLSCDKGAAPPPPADTPSPAAPESETTKAEAGVSTDRIRNANAEPGNWMSHGRTYDEQRFSPLTQINRDNVTDLGLAWFVDLDTKRGQEATPLVVDGVLYTTTAWSKVYAVDAQTGTVKWTFDPKVSGKSGADACCDVVNRGAAIFDDKLFFGALDGRLIALDTATGEQQWSVQTTPDVGRYTITGAPRIANGKIIIGNGGAEFGVRGFVSAYDAESGALVWRFYTVPGDPAQPFESPAMEMAAKTWTGEWWKYGGGGTVWDSIVFDPDLNLLYLGVGNGSPWNHKIRSPDGGDNLFLTSIVAVNADSGEYVWHYQTVPAESWDFTATQHMILADLTIDGRERKVIMQAPKNGFFYVLDRGTGELISAEPFVPVNWASHIDLKSGRPVENPNVRYVDEPASIYPAAPGAHNWQPMSYSPQTGLVYIPTHEMGWTYTDDTNFSFNDRGFNLGIDALAVSMPEDPAIQAEILKTLKGYTQAWDPVTQQRRWEVPLAVPWNSGILTTAGGLLFEGTGAGQFHALADDDGRQLWSTEAQTGVMAAPISYQVGDTQYVAVVVGWGGAFGIETGRPAKAAGVPNVSRILAYRLGGDATLPPPPAFKPIPEQPPHTADAETVTTGKRLYQQYCQRCHGDAAVSGNVLPDVRYMSATVHAQWDAIVLGGALSDKGMLGFADVLSKADADAIHAYAIKRAHDDDMEKGMGLAP